MHKLSNFGAFIKELRVEKNIPQRKVAAALDIDTSTLSKIERGEREANREMIMQISNFFELNPKFLLHSFLSDKIAKQLYLESDYSQILSLAEEKVRYLKNLKSKQSTIELK